MRQMRQLDAKKIPPGVDYAAIGQLRHEAREKLAAVQPRTLGQALRVSGITPADISVLSVHLAASRA
jgi:tRNA uridine 5-carboxymethylaminomethyl modification enzyme